MSKKAPVIIKPRNVVKGEIDEKDFRYIQETIESLITQEMITEKKVVPIAKAFEDGLSQEFKKDFIVIVALEPLYYIQYKYKNLMILSFDKMSLFFYRPRQQDIPRILKLEQYDQSFDEKVNKFIECVSVTNSSGLCETDNFWIQKFVDHMIKFFYKYQEKYVKEQPQFEIDFITKMRNYMVVIQKEMYWHIIMTKKGEYLVQQGPKEKSIEFSIDFQPMIPSFKQSFKLIMFQKKGKDISVIENIKSRKREAVGFIGLMLLFLCLVMCRNYINPSEIDEFSPFAIKQKLSQQQPHFIRDAVCPNKSYVLMGLGILFLSMVFARFFNRYQAKLERKKQQQKQEKQQQSNLSKKEQKKEQKEKKNQ